MKKESVRILDRRSNTNENWDILFNKMMLLVGKKWCDKGWLYRMDQADNGDLILFQHKSCEYPKSCKGCEHYE